MSEVLNAEVTSSEEGGLSRRRIVKGAAWSVPVIAAAIAAPAASASGGTVSATATWLYGATPQYFKIGGGGTKFNGTGPASLSVKNTGTSSFTGTITVTIDLAPVGTVLVGIGVESLLPATVSSASVFTQHKSAASFSYSATIASGATTDFPIRFHYETINPKPSNVTYAYVMTTSVVVTANGGGSLSLTPTATNPTVTFP